MSEAPSSDRDLLPPDKPAPPGGVEVAPGVRVVEDALRLQFARSGGPGGQNVNKLNTKAELWVPVAALIGLTEAARERLKNLAGHRLTTAEEIHIVSDTRRTQEANRAEVFDRLRDLIVRARHEPRRRKKTKPSRASKQRRLESKRRRGEIKAKRRYSGE
jgi:ribosome-associated protein